MEPYKRAPITEAVVEIRTVGTVQLGDLDRLVPRFVKRLGGRAEKLFDVRVEIGEVASKAHQSVNGFRITSSDGTRIVNIGLQSISTAKLAPYEGWEKFIEEARINWGIWLKVIDWQPISRIGVRFINRIDIPTLARFRLDDYLTTLPTLPRQYDANGVDHFAMNLLVPLGEDNLKLVLNSGTTESPLIGYRSLILDLDLAMDSDLPSSDDQLWAFIDRIRARKNDVFEACITDKARALFR